MKKELLNFIELLGFNLKNGLQDVWYKIYENHNDYEIQVDVSNDELSKCTIDWGNLITVERGSTSNFHQKETFVVLECVNRLLVKGYPPESITLEKHSNWTLGHKDKGYLDIWITGPDDASFMMIECKTYDKEHTKARNIMLSKGGQLFSYFIQEPETKYLCLYSSKVLNGEIIYKNDIIEVTEQFKNKSQLDIYKSWAKTFKNRGIFEKYSKPYNIEFNRILKSELKELKESDSKYIFNQFEEILRHHVVSDKPNAFNKIFNLFLSKVVDEDYKDENDAVDFQWQEDESNEDVLMRLSDLYKQGVKNYLEIDVFDYDDSDFSEQLDNVDFNVRENIKKMLIELSLYKNEEFTFKEVYNKKTFDENCLVVKEVVQLLQDYRIKYDTKQQFLGDFFEKLLNNSMKQEVGQFFTPLPLAKFICDSIPVEDIINKKIKEKDSKFLPYTIDFASGSGHFITEALDRINNALLEIKPNKFTKPMKNNYEIYSKAFKWASEFLYGIEKDYRLAKTTKVSGFLYGDGDANIICADGLGTFYNNTDFKGILKAKQPTIDNPAFDLIIANPPYSVSGFKNTIKDIENSFELFSSKVTDKSSEIECFFLERAKQLLKPGGYAGIVMPITLLNTDGLYAETRKLLLENFKIKGILTLSNNAFMATGTNTIILFLEKVNIKDNNAYPAAKKLVDVFFNTYKDFAFGGISNVIESYLSEVYNSITLDDYLKFLKGKTNSNIDTNRVCIEYKNYFDNQLTIAKLKKSRKFNSLDKENQKKVLEEAFSNYIVELEKEKLTYYLATSVQDIIIANSGEGNKERAFLGYKYSAARRNEGITVIKNKKDEIISSLYNENDLYDSTKLNSYILKNFKNEKIKEIDDTLKGNVQYTKLSTLIDFSKPTFDKVINTSFFYIEKNNNNGKQLDKNVISLKEICDINNLSVNIKDPLFANKEYNYIDISSVVDGTGKVIFNDKIKGSDLPNRARKLIEDDSFIISKVRPNLKAFAYFESAPEDSIFSTGFDVLKSKDSKRIPSKLLYYVFMYSESIMNQIKSKMSKAAYPSISTNDLENIKINLPDKDLTKSILGEIEVIKEEIEKQELNISKLNKDITQIVSNIRNNKYPTKKLGDVCKFIPGSQPNSSYFINEKREGYIRLIQIRDYKSDKFATYIPVRDKNKLCDKDDIMIGRYGPPVFQILRGLEGAYNVALIKAVPDEKELDKEYLYYYLKSQDIQQYIIGLSKRARQSGVKSEDLKNLLIELPDIKIQSKEINKIKKIQESIKEEENNIQENYLKIERLINNNF